MKRNEKQQWRENESVFVVGESPTERTKTSINDFGGASGGFGECADSFGGVPDRDSGVCIAAEGGEFGVGIGTSVVGADGESGGRGCEPGNEEGECRSGRSEGVSDAEVALEVAQRTLEDSEGESVASATDASEVAAEAVQKVAQEVGGDKVGGVELAQSPGGRSVDFADLGAEISMSRDDYEQRIREAYERGRNEAIEARLISDSHTTLTGAIKENESFPFLAGRKSVWGDR